MKISIYELLGLIKDGKAPKTILYSHIPYQLKHGEYVSCDGEDDYLFSGINIVDILSDTVKILEEEKKIPEKLNLDTDELRGKETPRAIDYLIESKINQVIDFLKSKGE